MFKCQENCSAACCGNGTPLEKEVWERNKHKAVIQPIEVIELKGDVFPFAETGESCIFLDRETKKCVIYDDRPEICRLFGTGIDRQGKPNILLECPYFKPNGNSRSEAKRKQLDRKVKKQMTETIKTAQNQ
jgi:Fe-S-cluster containining protein